MPTKMSKLMDKFICPQSFPKNLLSPEESLRLNLEQKAKNKEQDIIYNKLNSGIPSPFINKKLELISPANKAQKKALEFLLSWDPIENHILPFLYGPPGTGKSYLAKTFVNTAITKTGLTAKYVSLPLFFLEKATTFNSANSYSYITPLLNSYVLVLDDLGPNSITKNTLNILHIILDNRLELRKPTLITSNVAINEIAKTLASSSSNINECTAIEDRIIDLCHPIKMDGTSIRIRKAIKRKGSKK